MFSEEMTRNYADTRKRSSAEYVRFTPEYRVVLRMMNPKAKTVWRHWIQAANKGKGTSVNCPNLEAFQDACPLCRERRNYAKDTPEYKNYGPRRRFIVNVLDRTPHTTCPACSTLTPGVTNPANPGAKQCISCGADVKGQDFAPLNRIKIMEQGVKLFNEQLNTIAQLQKDELKKDITEYDITFTTQGSGRDKRITALPQDPKELSESELLDPETGEPQKLFDLELIAEPNTSEEIELLLGGGTYDDLNALRGVAVETV